MALASANMKCKKSAKSKQRFFRESRNDAIVTKGHYLAPSPLCPTEDPEKICEKTLRVTRPYTYPTHYKIVETPTELILLSEI